MLRRATVAGESPDCSACRRVISPHWSEAREPMRSRLEWLGISAIYIIFEMLRSIASGLYLQYLSLSI